MHNMKKILVTGGAGYIGSHTVNELLKEGYKVVVIDSLVYGHEEFLKNNVALYESDLCDTDVLDKIFTEHKIDAVIHFAGYTYVGESVTNPAKYINNNLVAGVKLLDAMIKYNVKNIVFSSSCAVYGIPDKIPINESCNKNPINPYGFTKLTFENILSYYDTAYYIKSVSLRYFNAAGAIPDRSLCEWHCPETHAIPLMLNTINDASIPFNVFGNNYTTKDGSCVRDYIHVCDLADAHIKALGFLFNEHKSEQFNIGTGTGVSVFELIKTVEKITGNKLKYKITGRRAGDPDMLVADPSKANNILKWKAKYDINSIVSHAWNAFNKWKDLIHDKD